MKATTKATLYGTRLSPFVEKCARALELKGIEFELVPPKGPQDLKKWNPTPQCTELVNERPALVAYLERVDLASRPRGSQSEQKLRAA